MHRLALPLAALLLSGCFQAVLREGPSSTLEFACTMMDPVQDDKVALLPMAEAGLAIDASNLTLRLVPALAEATGRPTTAFSMPAQQVLPAAAWNRSTLAAAAGTGYLSHRVVTLRILWVAHLDGNATGLVVRPGAVAVAVAPLEQAAQRLGRPVAALAVAAALHQVGHALGQVNLGIPVQDPSIQEREAPPTHDKDPASVLNAGWDDGRTIVWANATYDRYGDAALADWAAARDGVCA